MHHHHPTLSLPPVLLALLLGAASLGGCKAEPQPRPQVPPREPVATGMEPARAVQPEALPTADEALRAALAHPLRGEEERARDRYRHPRETLAFFGVEPDSTVVELWSGGGWYTHVLVPYLAERGTLYVTVHPADSEPAYRREATAGMKDYLSKVEGGDRVVMITHAPPEVDLGIEGEADVVLTFRNVHNWVKEGYDAAVYRAAYKALKPGGTFGVVEHRGPKGMTREQSAETGYMEQDTVIADIEAAGFRLVEASESNANPRDTKDHPRGVWTLPPTYRLGDVDRARYEAIGESDRMTLKFRKPAASAGP